ncbi:MAG: RNA methyltransferase [Chloroflexi bacterium]|nr:RNA methyltransferase [Chloroflexota bacterium]
MDRFAQGACPPCYNHRVIITSAQNPRVKHVIALRERKQRKRDGLMVVEGFDELSLALDCGVKLKALFYCPALFGAVDADGLQERFRQSQTEMIEVDERVFEKMAYRENPDGWLALAPAPQRTLDDLQLGPHPLLVIVEAVEKPGNLGAILRSADAAGADALILCDPTADIGNPNVIRSSRGTVFSVLVAEATSDETLKWLRARAIRVVAATPEASALFTEVDFRGAVAIAVGAERQGLSHMWRQSADATARIPMAGRVNSLNVASATTLFLFEAVRQRNV